MKNKAILDTQKEKMNNTIKKRFGLKIGALLCLLWAFLNTACGPIKQIPVETTTQVNIKDSTAVHWIDSVRIHEATRYRDLAWLGDTLNIEGQRSRMWAVADTTKEVILGGLEEDPVEEKTRIIYKDKIEYRDSIRNVEVPVPVEIEKEIKVYPRWMIVLSILGIVSTLVLSFQIYLKLKKKIPV